MVASPEPIHTLNDSDSERLSKTEAPYQEEMCEKLIQLSFSKIVNSRTERGGARLHKNLLILHLLQKARVEQRNRILYASVPMDTTSHVSDYQHGSSHSTTDDISYAMGNADGMEHMQSEQLMDKDGGEEKEEAAEDEDTLEIDEMSSQQQAAASVHDDQDTAHDDGTFSTCSYDHHSASACLSSSTDSNASRESGFDGNYRPETAVIQRMPLITQNGQQASSRQTSEYDALDSSIDVNHAANVEVHTTHGHAVPEEGGKLETINADVRGLRHETDEQRCNTRHRRRRSTSIRKRNVQRNHSTSSASSSSSSDSDESSSSEDGCCSVPKSNSDMESGEGKKSRDCLKRKLDESCISNLSNVPNSNDWYSSPKVACIVHGATVTDTGTHQHQQHQNLNGLISVLQSAALTSDEPTMKNSNAKHDAEDAQLALAVRIYDPEADDSSLPLQRSLSCPGLMELACES